MKHLIASLAAVLFLAGISPAPSKDSDEGCQEQNQRVVDLITRYREMRDKRRRLPEGTYDKDLRDDNGKLHKVLSSLGEELGHPPYTKQIIVGCLGEPDAIKSGQQMRPFLEIYHRELRKAGRKIEEKRDREYLIYHWRGGHDFMFFINDDGTIVDHGWWFAYE
jgi:hypothetical protein